MQYALNHGVSMYVSLTREYMEHGGRLPANCALTVYYLPVYPPYCDYNYGLREILVEQNIKKRTGPAFWLLCAYICTDHELCSRTVGEYRVRAPLQ